MLVNPNAATLRYLPLRKCLLLWWTGNFLNKVCREGRRGEGGGKEER